MTRYERPVARLYAVTTHTIICSSFDHEEEHHHHHPHEFVGWYGETEEDGQ